MSSFKKILLTFHPTCWIDLHYWNLCSPDDKWMKFHPKRSSFVACILNYLNELTFTLTRNARNKNQKKTNREQDSCRIGMYRDWRFADKDDSFSPSRTPKTLRDFYCELFSLVSSSYWYDRTDRSREKKAKSRSVSVEKLKKLKFWPRLTETWPFSSVTGLSGRTNS